MSDEPERTIARVAACVPQMAGPLTWAKVEAGWMVVLDCKRECTFSGVEQLLDHGQKVSHYCSIREEVLSVPDGPVPEVLYTTRTK